MILNLKQYPIKVLFPQGNIKPINCCETLSPFSQTIIDELNNLGTFLMSQGRPIANIVAAGYWLRKSHLLAIKAQYPVSQLKAKGSVFHIAPGNVDTLFFYSMIISLLCGNPTILRISNRLGEESQTLIKLLNQFYQKTLDSEDSVFRLLTIIQYPHNDDINAAISACCNTRVIWGNDQSIAHLSKFPLSTQIDKDTNNIGFPDRYSVAVIHLENHSQIEKAADNLIRDIKPYFQQACSSPKVVYWLNTAQSLQEDLWKLVDEKLKAQQSIDTADIMSQLLYTQRLPLLINDKKNNKNSFLLKRYDLLQVAQVESLTLGSIKSHPGLWVLLNLQVNSLDDIRLFEHCQTVTISGIEQAQWQDWQQTTKQPLKRIVPAGQALAFSHVWDGIDLISKLTINY